MTVRIEFVGEGRDQLGESPVWDPATSSLYWVDSVAPCIHRFDPTRGVFERRAMPDSVGSIGLWMPGRLIAALRDGFYAVDFASGEVRPLHRPGVPDGQRMNDGKMDRQGRFLSGTMRLPWPATPAGKLFRLDAAGQCDELETGIGISNALCFSPSGDTLYFADSPRGLLWSYPYDGATGAVGSRTVLADIAAMTKSGPDGATVDAAGCLWVTLVRTGQLARLRPDGALDYLVDLPVPHPTCPAFGGAGFDTLFVTSISDSGRVRSDHPDAGRMMALTGLGVQGLPEARFAGDWESLGAA
ncbi:MAG: SMP-30/gluconolactonase/LRE family protein [Alphaproteobacteria bacterium]|nr:SMP-30/gluconolactonase/LRE family protein [Alphaproteobacteria bacterium]